MWMVGIIKYNLELEAGGAMVVQVEGDRVPGIGEFLDVNALIMRDGNILCGEDLPPGLQPDRGGYKVYAIRTTMTLRKTPGVYLESDRQICTVYASDMGDEYPYTKENEEKREV